MITLEKSRRPNLRGLRSDFPILGRGMNGKPLVYLDNAATSQKPRQVLEAMDWYYRNCNSNIHRGIYALSEEATALHEEAREKLRRFINAKSPREIVFLRNATEALNLIAYSVGLKGMGEGDRVVSTVMEHHSNIVPWQFLKKRGVDLKFAPLTDEGLLNLEELEGLVTLGTKLVTVTHVSNVLGTINPLREIGEIAHRRGALFLVDGAQSVPHMPVDVQELGCDFMAISGHKMLGPTGIGVLYGREELLDRMEPFLGGGDMIREVHLDETKWNELPWKFEAGTPNIAGAVGLGAAVDYLEGVGMETVRSHEKELTIYALKRLSEVEGLRIYGPGGVEMRGGVVSFNLDGVHPHDVASILDGEGVAIRSGHHCAQPLMERLGILAAARASFYLYNTPEEVDVLVEGLGKVRRVFRR